MPESSLQPGGSRSLLAFTTCTVIWGSTFLVIRVGDDSMPPMWAASLRLIVAALVLMTITLARHRLPQGSALRAAIGYGIFQFGLDLPLLYWGELTVSSGLAAAVFATIPLTSALMARAFGLERLDALKLVGAAIALAGVAVLFSHDLATPASLLPLLAIVLATVAAALGSTLLKRGPRQDPIGANAVGAAVGIPFCLMASWLMHEHRAMPTHAGQIVPILYLAIAGSVGAFVVFAWLVNHWPVSSVAFIGVMVPVIAVTLGALVRHERLAAQQMLGSLLVLSGVLVAIVSDRRRMRRGVPRPPPRRPAAPRPGARPAPGGRRGR